MFNDRDLYILGGGGLLAIFCLLPSWPFWLKVSLALVIMMVALVVALMRVGPDRRTLEQQFYYFMRYRSTAKNFNYFGRGQTKVSNEDDSTGKIHEPSYGPVLTLAWDDVNVYILMTVWLAVIGIYFMVWLKDSGQLQLAAWLQQISYWR